MPSQGNAMTLKQVCHRMRERTNTCRVQAARAYSDILRLQLLRLRMLRLTTTTYYNYYYNKILTTTPTDHYKYLRLLIRLLLRLRRRLLRIRTNY